MKLAKSLLLGSAAGLAAVVGAQAADLPSVKAAPVEYVRVCSTYGAGFFYVPGTDSCLRISGRVRADFRYIEPFTRLDDSLGIRARGRLNIDHRTATSYGLLRAYLRYEIDRNSGNFSSLTGGTVTNDARVQQAFIQFGGLTAGRTVSFFSNADLPTTHFGTLRFDDAPDITLLAYTFSFGNGFSATISLEDPFARRNASLALDPDDDGIFPVPFARTFDYGGGRVPDLVANLKYAGAWGGAQLSGALHEVRAVGFEAFPGIIPDTEAGFAVGVSGYVNLPMLGAGDNIWAFLTYTDGAISYINGGQDAPNYNRTLGAGPLALGVSDAFVNAITGDIKTTTAWSIAGGFTHYWTPEFRSSLFGSYAQVDVPATAQAFNLATGTVSGLVDFNELKLGGNAVWMPVSGLQLGIETIWTRVESDNRVLIPVRNAIGEQVDDLFEATDDEDIWEVRLRVQRDF
jgi:Porin subfamily